jgi:tetratricopeptide (TPR) repeat protein
MRFGLRSRSVGTRPGDARHRSGRKGTIARGPRVHGPLPRDVVDDIRATARRGRADEAIKLLEEAVGALSRDRPKVAAQAASQAKGLAPRSGAIREVLGIARYQDGRFREALSELQAYRRMTGRLDQNHLIADCHRALGAPEKAAALVQEVMGARVSDEVRAEAAVVGGAALADLGRYDEALTLLRRFSTKTETARPHDLRVWYVTGDVLERAGRKAEAAKEFRRIVRHDPGALDAAERLAALS